MVDEFKKAFDAAKAMAEYHAEQAAVAAKTKRLRALRLEREARLGAEGSQSKPPKKSVPKK